MKKFIPLLVLIAALLALCSCGNDSDTTVEANATVSTEEAQEAQVDSFTYDEPQTIIDDENVTVSITGIEKENDSSVTYSDNAEAYIIKCTAENKNPDRKIEVSILDLVVKGYTLDGTAGFEIMPGTKSNDSMLLLVSQDNQSVVSHASDLAAMSGNAYVSLEEIDNPGWYSGDDSYQVEFSIE